jgi:murein L,D-transpeptidase YcbB/YkuD
MERWRWLPRDLGGSHVEVNIPEFELAVVRDGAVAHRAKVIVGKEDTPTPVFSNALQFIIVNPSWNVPQSIINKEMLPKHGGDLSYLARRGWKVGYHNGKLTVRQPPGEGNALGRIKFMFPNDFSVYLHDTPSRGLFSADRRAFSHGCMRVEDPFALAEAVLGPGSGWSEERVKRLIGGSERYINLAKPLPIHIEYFTAFVDEYGRLQMRDDLYGYSARVRNALGLGG